MFIRAYRSTNKSYNLKTKEIICLVQTHNWRNTLSKVLKSEIIFKNVVVDTLKNKYYCCLYGAWKCLWQQFYRHLTVSQTLKGNMMSLLDWNNFVNGCEVSFSFEEININLFHDFGIDQINIRNQIN